MVPSTPDRDSFFLLRMTRRQIVYGRSSIATELSWQQFLLQAGIAVGKERVRAPWLAASRSRETVHFEWREVWREGVQFGLSGTNLGGRSHGVRTPGFTRQLVSTLLRHRQVTTRQLGLEVPWRSSLLLRWCMYLLCPTVFRDSLGAI